MYYVPAILFGGLSSLKLVSINVHLYFLCTRLWMGVFSVGVHSVMHCKW